MLVIALDTSTPAVTAGLVEFANSRPQSLAERATVNPRAHGELLTPQLLDVLAESGHQLGEVDAVVVGAGPGPFTGLRVGMVTAAALGHAAGIRVYPVSSLDAIANRVVEDSPVLVLTDARRREVYWATYDSPTELGTRRRLTPPAVDSPRDLVTKLEGSPVAAAAGELAAAHAPDLGLKAVDPAHPSPEGLVSAAGRELSSGTEPYPLVPMYLRRPDAAAPGPPKTVTAERGRT
ncbi:tRNA (adenosine(37)-N6)-threonylcarbamoyltransferase complex dimerization subunit type 1 TsaB [Actinopolyspora mortivallis]|uniref:tRNA (Adenosine(37)-N6)-threonylcarbamoyltransferase complex dimerization subunit type 1 TsaB n=1 Tax=Actinopolyspora mortivallis TaxID=33906 RepID=A0A2T0H001_ACTMO|nr:tRNA (adenosine(37)-N6)-threonylcarbamoyltransferase complex dimerization subunit type 1 TsaB [Actinopolyspora mortivallis]PRW64679.1 tRNA (adenosine(37)-N6)-threonylcarbamoyltransferase complex dimerization subunit type 1 TsaB [Actinopolyspora mortivallis]